MTRHWMNAVKGTPRIAQTYIIVLDSEPHCAQGDNVPYEASVTVPSLALPGSSQRDRFLSLRRSDARVL